MGSVMSVVCVLLLRVSAQCSHVQMNINILHAVYVRI